MRLNHSIKKDKKQRTQYLSEKTFKNLKQEYGNRVAAILEEIGRQMERERELPKYSIKPMQSLPLIDENNVSKFGVLKKLLKFVVDSEYGIVQGQPLFHHPSMSRLIGLVAKFIKKICEKVIKFYVNRE